MRHLHCGNPDITDRKSLAEHTVFRQLPCCVAIELQRPSGLRTPGHWPTRCCDHDIVLGRIGRHGQCRCHVMPTQPRIVKLDVVSDQLLPPRVGLNAVDPCHRKSQSGPQSVTPSDSQQQHTFRSFVHDQWNQRFEHTGSAARTDHRVPTPGRRRNAIHSQQPQRSSLGPGRQSRIARFSTCDHPGFVECPMQPSRPFLFSRRHDPRRVEQPCRLSGIIPPHLSGQYNQSSQPPCQRSPRNDHSPGNSPRHDRQTPRSGNQNHDRPQAGNHQPTHEKQARQDRQWGNRCGSGPTRTDRRLTAVRQRYGRQHAQRRHRQQHQR